jgi:hypothetical protein
MVLDLQTDRRAVLATADVAAGWRRLSNTFGFCEESRLEMTEGRSLRVQASIRAWPNIFGSRLTEYPKGVFGLLKENWGRLELREESLRITINLVTIDRERLPRSGLPGFYQKPVELDRVSRVGFWLSLLVLRAELAQREYPEIMEWDTQFFMGGRPGSNRRH